MNPEIKAKILGGEAVDMKSIEEGSENETTKIVGYLRYLQCGIGSRLQWLPGGKSFEAKIHIPSIASADKRLNVVKFLEASPLTFTLLSNGKQPL